MSAHMVSAEHINVMVYAGLSIGGFRGGEVFILTTEEPTPYNGVQSGGGSFTESLAAGRQCRVMAAAIERRFGGVPAWRDIRLRGKKGELDALSVRLIVLPWKTTV